MKKFTLLLMALFCMSGMASAAEELTLGSLKGWGWSQKTIILSNQEIPQLPASVTIPGNYGDVKLYKGSFSATDYTGVKVVLREAPAEGTVQVYYRNAAQAAAYGGTYVHWEDGTLSDDKTTMTATFDNTKLEDDLTITQLALQNCGGSSSVEVIIEKVFLIDANGQEVESTGLDASGWNAATITPLTIPDDAVEKAVYSFTSQYGEIGVDFGATQELGEDKHFITLVSSEPLPEGFQWKVYYVEGEEHPKWQLGSNSVTVELTKDYTGISIQHNTSGTATLPADIKLFREIKYGNGAITRERLPIKADSYGNDAKVVDPNPGMDQGANGLPVRVQLSSQWQDIKLWKTDFDVTEYPAYRIVLAQPVATPDDIQMFYRTETHGSQGAEYCPWETNEAKMTNLSDDGCEFFGEFDTDALEGDNIVLKFAIQNRTGNTVNIIVKNVYLIDEDGNEVETEGLVSEGWNGGKLFPVGGSYDADGNIWDAYVDYYSSNSALGAYSGTVDENTYHKVTFYTEEPLPEGLLPIAYNMSFDQDWNMTLDYPEVQYEGVGTNVVSILIPRSYQYLVVQNFSLQTDDPVRVHFTKVVREVFEGSVPTAIREMQTAVQAPASQAVYDMQGRRVQQPRKGLYIVNGRKVIIK